MSLISFNEAVSAIKENTELAFFAVSPQRNTAGDINGVTLFMMENMDEHDIPDLDEFLSHPEVNHELNHCDLTWVEGNFFNLERDYASFWLSGLDFDLFSEEILDPRTLLFKPFPRELLIEALDTTLEQAVSLLNDWQGATPQSLDEIEQDWKALITQHLGQKEEGK